MMDQIIKALNNDDDINDIEAEKNEEEEDGYRFDYEQLAKVSYLFNKTRIQFYLHKFFHKLYNK